MASVDGFVDCLLMANDDLLCSRRHVITRFNNLAVSCYTPFRILIVDASRFGAKTPVCSRDKVAMFLEFIGLTSSNLDIALNYEVTELAFLLIQSMTSRKGNIETTDPCACNPRGGDAALFCLFA